MDVAMVAIILMMILMTILMTMVTVINSYHKGDV